MGVRRRTVLRAAAVSGVLGAAGCAGLARPGEFGDVVRIAVPWSAGELAAFTRVLDGLGIEGYELIPLGDDIDAALGASTASKPSLLVLPQPGHVAPNLAKLAELPADLWQPEYDRVWSQQLPSAAGKRYALPFKLANASVVWYRKDVFEARGLLPPATWAEWLDLNAAISAFGTAPLALGGADGWLLAGFFANVLLRNFVGTYDALIRQPHDPRLWESDDVRASFHLLAQMWGRPEFLAGGPERALIQQFPDAVLEVFRYKRAAMVVAPGFAESVIRRFGVPEDEVGTFRFPSRSIEDSPIVVVGDLLVLTRPVSDRAIRIIRDLAGPEAPVPWIRGTGGFLAANPLTPSGHYSPTMIELADEVRNRDIRFDLSDQLGAVGGREGLQLAMQDFLQALGAGVSTERASAEAMRHMVTTGQRAG